MRAITAPRFAASVIIVGILLAAGCWKPAPTLARQGGYVLRYALQPGESIDSDTMVAAIKSRLKPICNNGLIVRALNAGEFEIELPDVDADELGAIKKRLAATGSLEFRILAHRKLHPAAIARAEDSGGASLKSESFWAVFDPDKAGVDSSMVTRDTANNGHEVLVMEDDWDLNDRHLKAATAGRDAELKPCIYAELRGEGPFLMHALTTAHPHDSGFHLAIIFDGEVMTAPTVRSAIDQRLEIAGNFTEEEVNRVLDVLRTGRFPAQLNPEPVSQRQVQPQ